MSLFLLFLLFFLWLFLLLLAAADAAVATAARVAITEAGAGLSYIGGRQPECFSECRPVATTVGVAAAATGAAVVVVASGSGFGELVLRAEPLPSAA